MATVDASKLTEDHVNWLLVTAYNYLQQKLPERAEILLEFLRAFDSRNYQCLKMLSYVYCLQGKAGKGIELIEQAQRLLLSEEEHADMRRLWARVSQVAEEQK